MNNGDKIYQKYISGDKLNNQEVVEGIEIFKSAADALIKCGLAFSLTFKEANQVYMWLDSVQRARASK